MRFTGKFCLLLALSFFLSGAALAETLDKIVATVNGEIILYSELKERMATLDKLSPEAQTKGLDVQAQLEREVLQSLIRDRLTEAEIQRHKISVSKREIESTIDGIKQENGVNDAQFALLLQQNGKTLEKFQDEIKKQMERSRLVDRVLKSKILITEEQIDSYIKSGKSTDKERHRIGIIFLPTSDTGGGKQAAGVEKQARELHSRLKEGADFARMAKEHSKGPAALEGGDIGFIASDELAPPLRAAIQGLKARDVSDLIKAPDGYYIIRVLEVQKETQSASDTKNRQKIRRELLQNELNKKYDEWVRELESRAFIHISL